MKANDPLNKLLRAAARAERESAPRPLEMPFGWETRVLAAARAQTEPFSFLPLVRAAFACAAVVALACASLTLQKRSAPDVYEATLNYSIAAAYLE